MQSSTRGVVIKDPDSFTDNVVEEHCNKLIIAIQNRSVTDIDAILSNIIILRAIMSRLSIWVNSRGPFDINTERYDGEGLKWFNSLEGIIFNLSLINGGEYQAKRILTNLVKDKKYITVKKALTNNLLCMLKTDDFCTAYEHYLGREPQFSEKQRIKCFKTTVKGLSGYLDEVSKLNFNEFIALICKNSVFSSGELFLLRYSLPAIFDSGSLVNNLMTLPVYKESEVNFDEQWFKSMNGFITVLLFELFNEYHIEKYLVRLVKALEMILEEKTFDLIHSVIDFISSDDFINLYRLPELVKKDIEVIENWEERKHVIIKILDSLKTNDKKKETGRFYKKLSQHHSSPNFKKFCKTLCKQSKQLSLKRCKELRNHLLPFFSNPSQIANLDIYTLDPSSDQINIAEDWYFSFDGFLITLFYHILTKEDISNYWSKIIESIECKYREIIKEEPLNKFISKYLRGLIFFINAPSYQNTFGKLQTKRAMWEVKAELMKKLINQFESKTHLITTPAFQCVGVEENAEDNLTLQLLTPPWLMLDKVAPDHVPARTDSCLVAEEKASKINKRKRQNTKLEKKLTQDLREQREDTPSLAAGVTKKKLARKGKRVKSKGKRNNKKQASSRRKLKQDAEAVTPKRIGFDESLSFVRIDSEGAEKNLVTMEEQEQSRNECDLIELFPSTLPSIPEEKELVGSQQLKHQSRERSLLSPCGFFSSNEFNVQATRLKQSLMQATGHLSEEIAVGPSISDDPASAAPVNQLSSLLFEDKVLELPDVIRPGLFNPLSQAECSGTTEEIVTIEELDKLLAF